MNKAYNFLMQYREHFLQISDFDRFDTRFSEAITGAHASCSAQYDKSLLIHSRASDCKCQSIRFYEIHQ